MKIVSDFLYEDKRASELEPGDVFHYPHYTDPHWVTISSLEHDEPYVVVISTTGAKYTLYIDQVFSTKAEILW